MKKWVMIFVMILVTVTAVQAQCSICTKTAEQLGEGAGKGLNAGILYLMTMPLSIAGFIGYKWWQKEKHIKEN